MSRSYLLADGSGIASEKRRGDYDLEEEQLKAKPSLSDLCVCWCARALMATAWISSVVFALHIVAQYLTAIPHHLERWDRLHAPEPAAIVGIGIHFAAGALILILGSIQLIQPLRRRCPKIHRWTGRLYVTACLLTSSGGITYILVHGTIGGPVMSFGFAFFGATMLLAAIETYRHARAGRFNLHQLW